MEEKRKLPDGWSWVRLGDVIAEAKPGFASGARDPSGVVQLRMNNVDKRGKMVWSEFIRVPAEVSVVNEFQLAPGDVLFNNTNSVELVGKSALFLGFNGPVVYSNHFTRLRANPQQLDPRYLAAWLLRQWQLKIFENLCNRWIGQSAVKNDKLFGLEIPLPPLEEQKRIAAILNEQMSALERARVAAEAQLEAAKALPTAYLRAVFSSGPEAENWAKRPLGETSKLLPSKSVATDGDAEVLAVTTACLSEGGFLTSGVKVARMWAKDVTDCTIAPGEVLVARSNTPELVGRVAMFAGDPKGAVASDLTIRVWPTNDITAEFLTAYLSFLYQTGYWKERSGGASGSMKKITREQIQAEQVPLPALAVQQRIAAILSQQMASAERARRTIREDLDAINKLPAALLRRAFNGDL
jgi:type I restriction enzyme S subunit